MYPRPRDATPALEKHVLLEACIPAATLANPRLLHWRMVQRYQATPRTPEERIGLLLGRPATDTGPASPKGAAAGNSCSEAAIIQDLVVECNESRVSCGPARSADT